MRLPFTRDEFFEVFARYNVDVWPLLWGLIPAGLAAAAGAMVIVNTVVYVQSVLGRPQSDVAVGLALFGGGSMAAAVVLPRLLDQLPRAGP